MTIEDFKATVDIYITQLQPYDHAELYLKPNKSSWSIGQLYMHLLEETYWYFEQIQLCLGNSDHARETMSEKAKEIFRNNGFPNEIIKGDPFISDQIAQPSDKKHLIEKFEKLKSDAYVIWDSIESATQFGKRKHPGLEFFGPKEWFQYAEMHMRHHLRQKQRIDLFLAHR